MIIEAFFRGVPVSDFFFAELPAEQDDFAAYLARKIQQADVDVFHLHAGGVYFGDSVLGALHGAFALGFAASKLDHALTSATRWSGEDYLEHSTTAFLDRMSIISSRP